MARWASRLSPSAAAGLFAGRFTGRSVTWREGLLLAWILVPFAFFQIWPVKGFSYLVPLAPVIAVARRAGADPDRVRACARPSGGGTVARAESRRRAVARDPGGRPRGPADTSGLAGAGGLPGGREVGRWVDTHVPLGSHLITIGPSMANVIQYYSGRRCDALSVSPNPLHRNPTYQPIINADAALAAGVYEYIVWDVYSARRSPHFAARAKELAHRFGGHVVHVQRGDVDGRDDQRS